MRIFFKGPFLRGLFLEGLIFGGAYLWREIYVLKLIRLASSMEGNLPFLLCFTLYLRAISKYKPPGVLYLEGRCNRGFFALLVWGAYFEGAYTWRDLFSESYGIVMLSSFVIETMHMITSHEPFSASSLLLIINNTSNNNNST